MEEINRIKLYQKTSENEIHFQNLMNTVLEYWNSKERTMF